MNRLARKALSVQEFARTKIDPVTGAFTKKESDVAASKSNAAASKSNAAASKPAVHFDVETETAGINTVTTGVDSSVGSGVGSGGTSTTSVGSGVGSGGTSTGVARGVVSKAGVGSQRCVASGDTGTTGVVGEVVGKVVDEVVSNVVSHVVSHGKSIGKAGRCALPPTKSTKSSIACGSDVGTVDSVSPSVSRLNEINSKLNSNIFGLHSLFLFIDNVFFTRNHFIYANKLYVNYGIYIIKYFTFNPI